MSETFQLYRFHHPDGRAKDWAWRRDPAGTLTVRWGPAGRLVQHKTYPASAARQLQRTLSAKCRKGYVLVGERRLDPAGTVIDPGAVTPRASPASTTRPALTPVRPAIPDLLVCNLSQIDTQIEDGWF